MMLVEQLTALSVGACCMAAAGGLTLQALRSESRLGRQATASAARTDGVALVQSLLDQRAPGRSVRADGGAALLVRVVRVEGVRCGGAGALLRLSATAAVRAPAPGDSLLFPEEAGDGWRSVLVSDAAVSPCDDGSPGWRLTLAEPVADSIAVGFAVTEWMRLSATSGAAASLALRPARSATASPQPAAGVFADGVVLRVLGADGGPAATGAVPECIELEVGRQGRAPLVHRWWDTSG